MSEIDLSLLGDYITEAQGHLEALEATLLQLGQDDTDRALWDEAFRPVHTIKGAAQFIGLKQISALTHSMEDLLDLLREGEMDCNPMVVDLLICAKDRLDLLMGELEQTQTEQSSVEDLVEALHHLMGDSQTMVEADALEAVETLPEEIPPQQWQEEAQEVPPEPMIDTEMLQDFLPESGEHLEELEATLLQLGQDPKNQKLLDQAFRPVHTIKGAAQFIGLTRVASLAHCLEDLLDLLREGQRDSNPMVVDLLILGKDRLASLANELAHTGTEISPVDDLIALLTDWMEEKGTATASEEAIAEQQEQEPSTSVLQIDVELLQDFLSESGDHLQELEATLLQLGQDPTNQALLNQAFRPIHTIKGAAQFVGLAQIATLAHHTEDLLDLLREGDRTANSLVLDLLIESKDRLASLADELANTGTELSPVDDLVERLHLWIEGGEASTTAIDIDVEAPAAAVDPEIVAATEVFEPPSKAPPEAALREEVFEVPAVAVDPEIVAATEVFEPSSEAPPEAALQEEAFQAPRDEAIRQETQEEDLDQELYAIFVQQMREAIPFLQARINAVHQGEEPTKELGLSAERIVLLKSSAHYMGYEQLTQFYTQWHEQVLEAQTAWTQGVELPLDFLNTTLDRLVSIFPEIGPAQTETQPEIQTQAPPEKQIQEQPTETNDEQEQALFQRLSSALDAPEALDQENEAVEVLDALLTASESPLDFSEPQKQTPTPTPTPLPERRKEKDQRSQEDRRLQSRRSDTPSELVLKKSVRVDAEKIDTLMNQVGELVVDRSSFFQLYNEFRDLQRQLKEQTGLAKKDLQGLRDFAYKLSEAIQSLGRTSNDLQEGVMKIRMLPIAQLFNRYPRLVHDLTRGTDKQVRLDVQGEETELDKMIIEEVSDPLIHIIRNAVDHGMETTAERKALGKPETGTLLLAAYHESNHIVIEASDDGGGINLEQVRARALERDLITIEELERMPDREVMRLITVPGFSTAKQITKTSGRGVGMDVVKRNIEKLGGTLEIASTPGIETRFRLKIPLTLAIITALMVRVGKSHFTVPLANVEETLRIQDQDLTTIEGVKVLHLRGKSLPIFPLDRLFDIPADPGPKTSFFVIIVHTGSKRIGLVIDELIGQDEVVIKPLVDYLQENSGFSGVTVTGEGRISLILDIFELINMALHSQEVRQQALRHKSRSRHSMELKS